MHFGENQLSPGSFGISPLPTGHPHDLYLTWVRAFTRRYPRCTLPMGSSPGFGSAPTDSSALFRLAFAPTPELLLLSLAGQHYSPDHTPKGTPSGGPLRDTLPLTARTQAVSGLFHSPPGVLFTVPSRYSSPIGHQWYLALDRGRPSFPHASTARAVLTSPLPHSATASTYRALTVSGQPSQTVQLARHLLREEVRGSLSQQGVLPQDVHRPTHHSARPSLGSSPFARHYSGNPLFSSRYLDVSVPSVPFRRLHQMPQHHLQQIAPFGYPRISRCTPLPAAFRNALRPSSAIGAQASTTCASSLPLPLTPRITPKSKDSLHTAPLTTPPPSAAA